MFFPELILALRTKRDPQPSAVTEQARLDLEHFLAVKEREIDFELGWIVANDPVARVELAGLKPWQHLGAVKELRMEVEEELGRVAVYPNKQAGASGRYHISFHLASLAAYRFYLKHNPSLSSPGMRRQVAVTDKCLREGVADYRKLLADLEAWDERESGRLWLSVRSRAREPRRFVYEGAVADAAVGLAGDEPSYDQTVAWKVGAEVVSYL